jgi:hypothetical protein
MYKMILMINVIYNLLIGNNLFKKKVKNIIVLLCPCFFSLITIFQINLTPAPEPDSQGRNLIQFANMIRLTLGTSPFNYNDYGCW